MEDLPYFIVGNFCLLLLFCSIFFISALLCNLNDLIAHLNSIQSIRLLLIINSIAKYVTTDRNNAAFFSSETMMKLSIVDMFANKIN